MIRKYCLVRLIKAHGIRGLLSAKTFTKSPLDIKHYGDLVNQKGEIFSIISLREVSPNEAVIGFKNILDRTHAEALVGEELFAQENTMPSLEEDAFYYDDLKGLSVFDEAKTSFGHVDSVHNYGAGDFLEIHNGEKIYTIPFNKESIQKVLLEDKYIQIDPSFLIE